VTKPISSISQSLGF